MAVLNAIRTARARFARAAPPWRLMARYRLLGEKIDRNQWQAQGDEVNERYQRMMTLSWEQIAAEYPAFFARLSASVARTRGRVLELGCGTGNMTRWIAARPEVTGVVAVDGFEQAIAKLKSHALPEVEPRCQPIDALSFAPHERFDTLVACELLEHLYPDEERAMRAALRPHLAEGAGYVISVPVGWLEDPHHVRAFSPRKLLRHAERHYGPVLGRDDSAGYSQVVWGRFKAGRAG